MQDKLKQNEKTALIKQAEKDMEANESDLTVEIKQEVDLEVERETESNILDQPVRIKQELDYEVQVNFEHDVTDIAVGTNQELDYEGNTDRKHSKAASTDHEKTQVYPDGKIITSHVSSVFPAVSSLLYCEKCKLECDRGCLKHGPLTYIDKAEESYGSGFSKETDINFQTFENVDRKISERQKAKQSDLLEDDDGILSCGQRSYVFSPVDISEMKSVRSSRNREPMKNGGFIEKFKDFTRNTVNEMKGDVRFAGVAINGATSRCKDIQSLNVTDSEIMLIEVNEAAKEYTVTLLSEECSRQLKKESSMFKESTHHSGKEIGSEICGDLQSCELKKTHAAEKSFKCDVCGVEFSNSGHLKRHTLTHMGKKSYKYDICNAEFSRDSHVKRHRLSHSKEKSYKCDTCGAGFHHIGRLKIHLVKHTTKKPYKCDVCGFEFSHSHWLKSHQMDHTVEKPFMCDRCGVRFSQLSFLKVHERKHAEEGHYICGVCGARFFQRSQLRTHKKEHMGEMPHVCHICGAGFSVRYKLKIHKAKHAGEELYKCDVCGVRFPDHRQLKTHKVEHTREKLNACDTCGVEFPASHRHKCVEFSVNHRQQSHKCRHRIKKTHECDVCGLGFSLSRRLKAHKRKHKDNDTEELFVM